ncbi:MAG: hypothetical protein A2Y40_05770 [Candidatus Margulisbacteria bacterium GWF2_35_9]|nr:MAG: hypothetical protein A2Y40_05770 [Candidatus Margulisbacteria bacterium GWF2_35_9]
MFNISHMVVLGFLDQLGPQSGYDIIKVLEHRGMNHWTDIKIGSIYHSIKKLLLESKIEEFNCTKDGLRPEKTIYSITKKGQEEFDVLQEIAFKGLYPKFYGFNLALICNKRRSSNEIREYANIAIKHLEGMISFMDTHKKDHEECMNREEDKYKNKFRRVDLHMSQMKNHIEAERNWLVEVAEAPEVFTINPCLDCMKRIDNECVENDY